MGYEEKRKQLMQEANDLLKEEKVAEAKAKMQEVKDLDEQHEEEVKAKADFEALNGKVIAKKIDLIDTDKRLDSGKTEATDIFATEEYERAFMDYVQHNTPIPQEFRNEATKSTATDVSALIPTTLVKEIIREIKSYGNLYAKVRKLNVQGGVEIPILTLKPEAKWVGEDKASEDQKIEANTKLSFSYHGLECKIAMTLLASVVTLEEFKNEFIRLAVEAMTEALDKAIMNGTGSGQPLGITKDSRIPAANTITLTSADIASWSAWKKKVFAKMKKSYRKGEFIMAQETFDGYIDGMEDKNGQPIGRVNYGIDGGETYRFGGKTVETVENDILTGYDDASSGDVIAVFADLSNYAVNSNMQMTTVRWSDHDNNLEKQKVTLIIDGKLVDPNGVLLIKKGE